MNSFYRNKAKQFQQSKPMNTKMSELQNEITKHKEDAKPKSEEEKLQDILVSGNTSLKDKKLKELIQKNKDLYVSFEKEKTM